MFASEYLYVVPLNPDKSSLSLSQIWQRKTLVTTSPRQPPSPKHHRPRGINGPEILWSQGEIEALQIRPLQLTQQPVPAPK